MKRSSRKYAKSENYIRIIHGINYKETEKLGLYKECYSAFFCSILTGNITFLRSSQRSSVVRFSMKRQFDIVLRCLKRFISGNV